MKFRVQCVRYGHAEVEADSISGYTWSDADSHQVVEEIEE